MPTRRTTAITLIAAAVTTTTAIAVLPQQNGQVDLLTQANVRIDGAAANDISGDSVVGVGDVNGDDRADIAIGAPAADNNGRANSGSTYVIYGRSTPTNIDLLALGTTGFRIDGATTNDQSGQSVAGAGDVNGDGRADIAISAPDADNNARNDSGSTYVIYGPSTPANIDLLALGTTGFRIDGAAANDFAGTSLAGAGDVNGDGRADIAISAPDADNNARVNSGSTYVIYGQPAPTNIDLLALGTAGFRVDGAAAFDQSGLSVAGVGDVNGDGRPDIAIGARFAGNNARANSGSTYVIFGRSTPTNIDLLALGTAGFRIDGASNGDLSGTSVAGVGDVNGDGRADIAISAPDADNNGRANSGSTYVIYGRSTPTNIDLLALGTTGFRIDGAPANDRSGWSVAGVGDVNGDGRADIAISVPDADNNARANSGSTYVIYGRSTPTNLDLLALSTTGFRIDGAATADQSGQSVAGAGDVNGDGRPDVAIGARFASNNARTSSGSTYVIYGFGLPSVRYPNITTTVGLPMAPAPPLDVKRTGTATFQSFTLPLEGIAVDPSTGELRGTPVRSGRFERAALMTDLSGTATTLVTLNIRRCVTPRNGSARRNTIRGDNRSENINGKAGNDVLLGGANEDCIAGGLGNDTIAGGPAFDTLSGGPGNDVMLGGSGNDTIKAGPGRDTITAGKGNDTINARDKQPDTINCGPGQDTATIDRTDRVTNCEVVRRG